MAHISRLRNDGRSISALVVLASLLSSAPEASAQQPPEAPRSWPLPDGTEVSGSVFVTAGDVRVLDWRNNMQYDLKRSALPKKHAEFAQACHAELTTMTLPFDTRDKEEGEEFVRGTYQGKMPYDVAKTQTCTMLVGGLQCVQHSIRGKICKVDNANMDNKKDGIQLKLYPTGEICQMHFFNDGTMVGAYLQFYPDGTILHASQKDNGKSIGVELNFHPNGNLSSTVPVKNGVFEGEARHFDLDGKLYGTQDFFNNRPGSMNIVREIESKDELDRVTASANQREAISRFGDLWTR